ncbi:MAG: isopentenyl phosphate kinase [Candidatus Micrarchaeia archaeon]
MDFDIIKIGGSVITDKSGFEKARLARIKEIAAALAAHHLKGRRFVLVLGAGSFAHPHVIKYGLVGEIESPSQLEGVQAIRKSVAGLAHLMALELAKNGCRCVFCPIGSLVTLDRKAIVSFDSVPFEKAMANNEIPITIGDMARDGALGYAPLSGDRILAHLGKGARRALLVSDMDGVMADGKVIPSITAANFKGLEAHLGASKNTDVTGGMRGKVLELLEMKAPAMVIPCGKGCANLKAALEGKACEGTKINF